MIRFDSVSFSYEEDLSVLKDISFHIRKGEMVGLIGANGAGKSTLMKLMLGLIFPSSGTVEAGGIPVTKANLSEVRKKVGYVLQNSDNQMFMPTIYDDMIFGPVNYGLSREEAEKKADEILTKLGLQELKHRYNHKISGGEKRMAAIATVLAMEPEVILMDEPTSALDPWNRRIVINTIKELDQTGLIASHDLDMIWDTCDRVLLLSGGQLAADGPAKEILKDRELLEKHRMELPLSLTGSTA